MPCDRAGIAFAFAVWELAGTPSLACVLNTLVAFRYHSWNCLHVTRVLFLVFCWHVRARYCFLTSWTYFNEVLHFGQLTLMHDAAVRQVNGVDRSPPSRWGWLRRGPLLRIRGLEPLVPCCCFRVRAPRVVLAPSADFSWSSYGECSLSTRPTGN